MLRCSSTNFCFFFQEESTVRADPNTSYADNAGENSSEPKDDEQDPLAFSDSSSDMSWSYDDSIRSTEEPHTTYKPQATQAVFENTISYFSLEDYGAIEEIQAHNSEHPRYIYLIFAFSLTK